MQNTYFCRSRDGQENPARIFEKSEKVFSSKLFFLVFLFKHCFKTEVASVNYEVLTNIRPVDCDRAVPVSPWFISYRLYLSSLGIDFDYFCMSVTCTLLL